MTKNKCSGCKYIRKIVRKNYCAYDNVHSDYKISYKTLTTPEMKIGCKNRE